MAMTNAERQAAYRARNDEEIRAIVNASKRMLTTFDALKWANDETRIEAAREADQAASELHWRTMKIVERFNV